MSDRYGCLKITMSCYFLNKKKNPKEKKIRKKNNELVPESEVLVLLLGIELNALILKRKREMD
jgi:hypothetical protein